MTITIIARRSLLELAKLRGILDGSVSPEDLGLRGKGSDGGNRREAALRLVDRLARLHATVLDTAGAAEQIAFAAAGGKELLDGQDAETQEEQERRAFGFARYRSDTRDAA
jgi:hypothetical protein